ncbi:MAG: thiamine-phosphate kinase [Verrucomicrobiales bacterium]|nr:thiamine-phosphate kinase [Verrucomicrobiales bacterium]
MGETSQQQIGDVGEEALVQRLVAKLPGSPSVIIGPGDDCAVVETGSDEWLLLKTDCLIESVHFHRGTDPERVGAKALNRALSDIAAMGGLPRHALVTVAVDARRSVSEIEGWYEGMIAAAERFDCVIVGGETSSLPGEGAVISVSLTGVVEPGNCVKRSGAKIGDVIVVTGRLGGSFESGRHLDFLPRIPESRFLVQEAKVSSMMDLSDGPGSDLPRLAKASGVGFRLDREKLPLHEGVTMDRAIRDGEDYELLCTMPPEEFARIKERWKSRFPETELTVIGVITEEVETDLVSGWEHFQKS